MQKLMDNDHMEALRRFAETCEDGEGYDVSKSMMKDLAKIGAVSHIVRDIYEITRFGEFLLDAPPTPSARTDELALAVATDVMTAIAEALDQPWREPVAAQSRLTASVQCIVQRAIEAGSQRQPLTDAVITSIAYDCNALPEVVTDETLRVFARAIEAELKGAQQ